MGHSLTLQYSIRPDSMSWQDHYHPHHCATHLGWVKSIHNFTAFTVLLFIVITYYFDTNLIPTEWESNWPWSWRFRDHLCIHHVFITTYSVISVCGPDVTTLLNWTPIFKWCIMSEFELLWMDTRMTWELLYWDWTMICSKCILTKSRLNNGCNWEMVT